ncbi:hypothetical protein HPB47_020615 [Ixodes persulcatus]|uniref:Uncharacterized protein n=1 Tax=Ixodes persulcatus TaxID=34615 RepID=A0AC60QHG8_IXOPE|nr:hypothetical protein HPB47_020615 [Ixodes persulcatus]
MLRLKHQIIDGEQNSHLDTRAIPGLDITKAFNNVKHDTVLEKLEKLGVGARTYDYIQDFLNHRRGTPQDSVLSPYLFNFAMIGLPEKLEAIADYTTSITRTIPRPG